MASFAFTRAKYKFINKEIDLEADTIRILIVMENSSITVSGQQDVSTISAFTTLDEMDGANYVRKALTTKVTTQDNTNHRAWWTSDTPVWTSLGIGTRDMKGVLIYQDPGGTNLDNQNIPLFWLDSGFPIPANGTDFNLPPNAITGWSYLE